MGKHTIFQMLDDQSLIKNRCFINGHWVEASNGEILNVHDPFSQDVISTVPNLGVDETRQSVESAHSAFSHWKEFTAKERSKILRSWFDLIVENKKDIAKIITAEQGKSIVEAEAEVLYGASFIEWFSEEAKRVYGDTIPTFNSNKRIIVLKQPVGVVAAITPWNFPIAMITRKVAPALAAGCTVVVKPAEDTPLTALAVAELAQRSGMPNGVFNVVTGAPELIGRELTSNSLVRKLSFTGSTDVGKLLMRQCANTMKKVSLELGGNAPFIVFEDANLDDAIEGAVASKYRNSGQTCICTNRFIVQEKIYDEFAARLAAASKSLHVGPGYKSDTQQGPLINEGAVLKIEQLLADAVSKGANVIEGGKRHSLGGTFFEPTVVCNIDQNMSITQEEIFGPISPLYSFSTDQEAIDLANSTQYGLAAYFYSRDIGRIYRVAESLDFGMVGINDGVISTEVAPFGGVKESGIGREGSKYGIDEYLEIKYLCLGGVNS